MTLQCKRTSDGELLRGSDRDTTKAAFQNPIRWIMFSNETLRKTGLLVTRTRFGHN